MKTQYKALIVDTVLKELRSKTLIFIFVATTLSILVGHMILAAVNKELVANSSLSIIGVDILSTNFRILNSISFIIAAIFGVSIFRSDFRNNIIYQYLAFPISRTEYFFSRVLGTWLLVLGYYLYAYALSTILFSFAFKKVVFTGGHFLSFLVLALYLLLVIFISIFFSLLMNKIGALFMTFTTCIIGALAYGHFSRLAYSEYLQDFSPFKGLGVAVYMLFPRITFLSEESSNLLFKEVSAAHIGGQITHLVIISALYVYLANYLVKRQDF